MQGNQGSPDWYNAYQQQQSANEDGGGLDGVTPPAMKFKEGDNVFRLMPPAEAIPEALAAAKAGQAADWARGVPPACTFKVYLPSYSDGPAKGISLFGNKAVVSPSTIFPGEHHPIYGADPAQEFLVQEGIRWMKLEELKRNPLMHALRDALNFKDRTAIQIVHVGVSQNGAYVPFPRGQAQVETYFVYANDFESVWKRPLFDEPLERSRRPFDPTWMGLYFAIFRKGKDINTEYSNLRGLYGPPYGDFSSQWGYPLARDQQGHPDWPEIERLLAQVKPWKQMMHIATPEEVKREMDRVIAAVREKYAPAQVSVPAMPVAGGPPGYAPPAGPPGYPSMSPAGAGGPPAAPPAPPAGPPGYAPPAGPPAGPPGYAPPAGPPAGPPGYAPPAGPPAAPQSAPPAPAGPPGYGGMPAVPSHPPGTPPISAGGGYPMNPQQAQQAVQGTAPPAGPPGYAPPAGPPAAPPQAPQYGAPPQAPQYPPPPPGGTR